MAYTLYSQGLVVGLNIIAWPDMFNGEREWKMERKLGRVYLSVPEPPPIS